MAQSRGLLAAVLTLHDEAMSLALKPQIQNVVRQWLPLRFDETDESEAEATTVVALMLAGDLELFKPSSSGKTTFDRLAQRRPPDAEFDVAALKSLRNARFLPLRILSRSDAVFTAQNLATGATVSIFDEELPQAVVGSTLVARVCPLSDDLFGLVGVVTPLDDAGLAVALDFVRPGKGLTNDHRCASAVYRHVVRHGGPKIAGLNDFAETDDPAPHGFELNELDAIARLWTDLGDEELPGPSVETVRNVATPGEVLKILFKAAATQQAEMDLARGYRRIADVLMDTLHRRAAVGSGRDLSPLDTIAAAIAHEVATNDYPREAQALFVALRTKLTGAAKPRKNQDDLTRVIERIRALRAKTIDQGCTEEEALAAASKVAELLDRYGLSLSEIDIRTQTCEGVGVDSNRKRVGPLDECLPSIAGFCDCKAWQEKTAADTLRTVFFGLPADVAAAHYLYERVAAAFETETTIFQRSALYIEILGVDRRGATTSFQVGLGHTISTKLAKLRATRDETVLSGSGRELVAVKHAVIDDDLAKLGLAFKSKPIKRHLVQPDSYEAGRVAGQRFQARREIDEPVTPRQKRHADRSA
ncbi:DUF2786 domain-containing protein [Beijerinckia sp. L45]|uniref:DUF2786 domain-containing protein n=1 Tax=Beijerinckia sp. L45 TaxID=1641855 RepID=UPI00131BA2CC|nr:DUF2786 domain-containing protein [Beijerinckia sp. L45]